MNNMRKFAFVVLVLSIVCCKGNSVTEDEVSPGLLYTVPSDAAGMVNFSKCSDAIASGVVSSGEFSTLSLGELSDSPAAISFYFNGSLVTMLSIDLGTQNPDSISVIPSLLAQAQSLGLESEMVSSSKLNRNALLLSGSKILLEEARRHVETGHSLMDSYGGEDAAHAVGTVSDFVVFPNGKIDKLLKESPVPTLAKRSEAVDFIKRFSEWTVASSTQKGAYTITPVGTSDSVFYMTLLNSLEASETTVAEILPEDFDLVLAIQIASVEKYLSAWALYQDAHKHLENYRKMSCDAEAWARQLDLKEVALAHIHGTPLLFVRSAHKNENSLTENTAKGYLSILFGSKFALEDEGYCLSNGKWQVFGPKEALESYSIPEKKTERLPSNEKMKCLLVTDEYYIENKTESTLNFKIL